MLLARAVWVVSALAVGVIPGSQAGAPMAEPLVPPVAEAAVPASEWVDGTVLGGPGRVSFDDLAPRAPEDNRPAAAVQPIAPVPRPPKVTARGRDPRPGTAQAVLAAGYRAAARTVPSRCHLQVWHLAAIGQIESGSVGGRSVMGHRVGPAIYGPLLDGGPFAVIVDSDAGRIDGASDYDRAVGPMQFLPGTWRWAGRDGDADGFRDPQNVFDATAATAGYLCRDGRDLAQVSDLRAAFWSYNQSAEYVSAALEWASFFKRNGLAAMTDVAFRVGSGGRASDLAVRGEDLADAATAAPTTPPTVPARPRPAPATTAPTPVPTSSPPSPEPPASDPSPTDPTPDPTTTPTTTPTPDPTTTPTPTTPTTPGPTPSAPPSLQ